MEEPVALVRQVSSRQDVCETLLNPKAGVLASVLRLHLVKVSLSETWFHTRSKVVVVWLI